MGRMRAGTELREGWPSVRFGSAAPTEPMERQRRHKKRVEHAHKRRCFTLRANDARAGEIARVSG